MGQEVTRTGVADGWSRIIHYGGTAYVASNLLSTEKPEIEEEPEVNEVENNTVANEIANEVVQNTVTNEVVAEKTELEILQEEIGVLPEVGKNIAVQIYIVVTAVAIIVCGFGLYYINKKDVK